MSFSADWLQPRAQDLGKRYDAFYAICAQLEQLGRPVTIVETGCVRMEHNWAGDGQSTIVWDQFAQHVGGRVLSVDLDPHAAALAHSLTSDLTTVECNDSVAWLLHLATIGLEVDFLYLDSYDIDWSNPEPSMQHHMKEIEAAAPMLHPGSIVAVDDNQPDAGKGYLVGQYAEQHGWTELHNSYVRAWVVS